MAVESHSNNKFLEKITSSVITWNKNIHRSKLHLELTHWRRIFLQLLLLKVCELFRLRDTKKLEVYFGLYESSFTFIEKRRPSKYCSCEVNLTSYIQLYSLMFQDVNLTRKQQFKMLVAFSPIFVGDTKIIFRYDFVAPLKIYLLHGTTQQQINCM